MKLRFVIVFLALGALVACGAPAQTDENSEKSTAPSVTELDSGTIYEVKFHSGLHCDVFSTYEGGGVSCDWGSFEPPSEWKTQTGSVDSMDSDAGLVEVSRYADGHLCVTYNNYDDGGIDCTYPAR